MSGLRPRLVMSCSLQAVPGPQPARYLVVAEWLEPQCYRPVGIADPVRDGDPAGDKHDHGPALVSLALLEPGELKKVIGLAHAGRLEQLIEAVQQHHRDGSPCGACYLRPVHAKAGRCADRILDLVLDLGLGRHLAQRYPHGQETPGRQPCRQHLRQH